MRTAYQILDDVLELFAQKQLHLDAEQTAKLTRLRSEAAALHTTPLNSVWLNTADGSFSDSFDPKVVDSNTIADAQQPGHHTWKLLEYRCVTQPDFKFTHHMKLR